MNVVEQAKLKAKWNDDIKRRFETAKQIDYYENNQNYYLENVLKKAYPKTAKDIYDKYNYCYPLTSRIIDDISILFETPVTLTIDNENLEELFNDIIEKADLNPIMQKINKLVNLTYKVGAIPVWRNDKVEIDILTADNCFVVQDEDDPTNAKELYYQVGKLENTPGKIETVVTYIKWTAETQSLVDVDNANGHINNEREAVPNKFGQIPVVWFVEDILINTFWQTKANHIVNTNEIVNCELTNFRYMMAFQAFSTLVLKNYNEDKVWTVSPANFIALPSDPALQADPDAEYITPDPKMETVWKVINDMIVGAAQSVGISAEAYRKENSTFNSGYQLRLSKQDIIKKTESDRPYYRKGIKELVRLMLMLYTQNNESKTFESAKITVDFGELQFDSSPQEREEIRAMQLANGTRNEIDFIIEDNPDLTREEAIKLYQKKKAEKSQYAVGVGLEDAIETDEDVQ